MSIDQKFNVLVQEQLQPFWTSKDAVGLAAGVYASGTPYTAFGGSASAGGDVGIHERTLFEIGSITKVFTTTLLAAMHVAGEVKLDDAVNRYLPAHGRLRDPDGDAVTFRHLATHTSGLPRLPVNLSWKQLASDNPYAEYSAEDLYAGLAVCRLKNRPGSRTRYSNLGFGLLGHVLSLVGGVEYERLVIDRVLRPLEMHDTVIQLSAEQRERLAPGHSGMRTVANWDFQALAGAGAFRSTVAEMLRFLRANLQPPATPLGEAIKLTHEMQTEFHWKWYRDFGCVGPLALASLGGALAWHSFGLPAWLRIAVPITVPATLFGFWQLGMIGSIDDMALGWHIERLGDMAAPPEKGIYWHNGGTGGYRSYLAFSKQADAGVVLLTNSDREADSVGMRLLKKLMADGSSTPESPR
jgi:D-alanyl-D-alanine-carboxypeptidase/D-alanyl-D-alanine-endopeptidase